MKYRFESKVVKVERKSRLLRAWKDGDDVKTEEEHLGWFVWLENMNVSLYMGEEKPTLGVGQSVTITIE